MKNRKLVTLTAVYPPPRFGSLILKDNLVTTFSEKTLEILEELMVVFLFVKNV